MLPAEVKKHRFTVEEYHKMGEAGIFGEDDRVELIDGEVIEMNPIGWHHARCVKRLNTVLGRLADGLAGGPYEVDAQNPVVLSEYGDLQPDLALVRAVPLGRLPAPANVALIVEISDTNLITDLPPPQIGTCGINCNCLYPFSGLKATSCQRIMILILHRSIVLASNPGLSLYCNM